MGCIVKFWIYYRMTQQPVRVMNLIEGPQLKILFCGYTKLFCSCTLIHVQDYQVPLSKLVRFVCNYGIKLKVQIVYPCSVHNDIVPESSAHLPDFFALTLVSSCWLLAQDLLFTVPWPFSYSSQMQSLVWLWTCDPLNSISLQLRHSSNK